VYLHSFADPDVHPLRAGRLGALPVARRDRGLPAPVTRIQGRVAREAGRAREGPTTAPKPAWAFLGVSSRSLIVSSLMCAMPRRQNWKRRWFVLLDRQLIYYETEEVERFLFSLEITEGPMPPI